ncbi:MAG: protein kinase, partial [archaeon]
QTYGAVVTAITGFTVGSTSFLISLFALGTALGLIGGGAYLGVKAILANRANKSNHNNGESNHSYENTYKGLTEAKRRLTELNEIADQTPEEIAEIETLMELTIPGIVHSICQEAIERSVNQGNYENTPDGLYKALTDTATLKSINNEDRSTEIDGAIVQVESYVNQIELNTYRENSLYDVATARKDLEKFTNLTDRSYAARDVQAHIQNKLRQLEIKHHIRFEINCSLKQGSQSQPLDFVVETEEGFEDMSKAQIEALSKDKDHARLTCKVAKKPGTGSYSEVYKAHTNGRVFALKILKEEFMDHDHPKHGTTNRNITERSTREGAIMQEARGERHVMTIFGKAKVPETDQPILVLEYIESNLEQRILARDLKDDEIINISLQIIAGLKNLLAKGIHHRDIKPANIFLATTKRVDDHSGEEIEELEVKLGDFGLSKVISTDGLHTRGTIQAGTKATILFQGEGAWLGTHEYLAPEYSLFSHLEGKGLLEGEAGRAIRREWLVQNDIYALGVILYLMKTNRLPVQINDLASYRAFACDVIPGTPYIDLVDSLRRVDTPIQDIISQAMAKADADRPASTKKISPKGPDAKLFSIMMNAFAYLPSERYRAFTKLEEHLRRYHEEDPELVVQGDLGSTWVPSPIHETAGMEKSVMIQHQDAKAVKAFCEQDPEDLAKQLKNHLYEYAELPIDPDLSAM